MRDFKLFVPADCCVSETVEANETALEQMQIVLKADISSSQDLDLVAIQRGQQPDH